MFEDSGYFNRSTAYMIGGNTAAISQGRSSMFDNGDNAIRKNNEANNSFSRNMTNSVTQLTIQLISNQQLIGRYLYMTLIAIEYAFMSFLVIIHSQPKYDQTDDYQNQSNEPEDSNSGISRLDTSAINLFSLNSSSTQGYILPLVVFSFCIMMGIMLMYNLISTKNQILLQQQLEAGESSFLMQMLSAWLALHRSILTFVVTYSVAQSLISIMQEVKYNNTGSNKTEDESNSGSSFTYIMIIMTILGLLSFLLTFFLSFLVMRFPLASLSGKMPWNSNEASRALLLKESYKVLLIVQDYFIQKYDLYSNQVVLSIYLSLIILAPCLISIIQGNRSVLYFDIGIQRVNDYSFRLYTSVVVICIFRFLFNVNLLEIAVFLPQIAYVLVKVGEWRGNKVQTQMIWSAIEGKKLKSEDYFKVLQHLLALKEKLAQSEQNNYEDFDSFLSLDHKNVLSHLHYCHRLQCYKDQTECICFHYHYLCNELFNSYSLADEEMHLYNQPIEDGPNNQGAEIIGGLNHQDIHPSVSDVSQGMYLDQMKSTKKIKMHEDLTDHQDINIEHVMTEEEQKMPSVSFKRIGIADKQNELRASSLNMAYQLQSSISKKHQLYPTNKRSFKDAQHIQTKSQNVLSMKHEDLAYEQQRSDINVNFPAHYIQSPGGVADAHQSINHLSIDDIFQPDSQQLQQSDVPQRQQSSVNNKQGNTQSTFGKGSNQQQSFAQDGVYSSNREARLFIKGLGFKHRQEARVYYYGQLLNAVVEQIGKMALGINNGNNGGIASEQNSLNDQDSQMELKLLFVQFLNNNVNRPFQALQHILQLAQKDRQNEDLGDFHGQNSSSSESGLGTLQKIKFRVCEHLLMKDIVSNVFAYQPLSYAAMHFSEYLEKSSQLAQLDDLYDETAQEISDFWTSWNSNDPDISLIFKKGRRVSQSIQKIALLSKRGDCSAEQLAVQSDMNRYQLRMYFHEKLINDSFTAKQLGEALKQRQMYNISSKKMHGLINEHGGKQKIQQQMVGKESNITLSSIGMKGGKEFNEHGMCLVSITSADFKALTFRYANKALTTMLGLDAAKGSSNNLGSLLGKSINMILPKSYRLFHDELIRRLFHRGTTRFLGKDRIVFIKDFHRDFVKPVKLKVEFGYDQRFGYAFVVTFELIQKMASCLNSEGGAGLGSRKEMNVQESMMFLVDEDYNINEITQNVLSMAGFEGSVERWDSALELRTRAFNMDLFIPNFTDLVSQARDEAAEQTSQQLVSINNRLVHFRKYNVSYEDFDDSDTFLAVLTYVEEQVPVNAHIKLFQGTCIITPLSKHPEGDSILKYQSDATEHSKGHNQHLYTATGMSIYSAEGGGGGGAQTPMTNRMLLKGDQHLHVKFGNNNNQFEIEGGNNSGLLLNASHKLMQQYNTPDDSDIIDTNQNSQSSREGGSSSVNESNAVDDAAYIVQNLLYKPKTPRILTVNTYFIVVIMTSFILVSLYNLIVFMVNHAKIQNHIKAFNLSYQRNIAMRGLLLDLQVIHNIAYFPSENNKPNALGNLSRLETYQNLYTQHLVKARDLQKQVDLFESMYKIGGKYDKQQLQTFFLSEVFTAFDKKITFKNQNSLFIEYLESLKIADLILERPALNITSYPKSEQANSYNRESTDVERALYYIFANGLNRMEESQFSHMESIFINGMQNSQESRKDLSLSTYISIGVLSLVLVLLIPLIINFQKRTYRLLEFMLFVPHTSALNALGRCHDYQQKLSSIYGYVYRVPREHQQQQQSVVNRSALNNSSLAIAPAVVEEDTPPVPNRNSKQQSSINVSKFGAIANSRTRSPFSKGGVSSNKLNKKVSINPVNEDNQSSNSSNARGKNGGKGKQKRQQKRKIQLSEEGEGDSQSSNSQRGEIENSSREMMKKRKLQDQQSQQFSDDTLFSQKQMKIDYQIARQSLKQKVLTILGVLFLIGYFAAQILISQRYGNNVFEVNEQASSQMRVYFQREAGALNLLTYIRQQYISNTTVKSRWYAANGIEYTEVQSVPIYIDQLMSISKDIQNIKGSFPAYMESASSSLIGQDLGVVCNQTYQDNQIMSLSCEQAMDGLLLNGIDSAMDYLISLINQMLINYQSQPSRRTTKYLYDSINSPRFQDMEDLVVFYMRDTFQQVQRSVILSLQNYVERLKTYYLLIIGLFIGFSSLTAIIVGYIVFRRVKRRILEIQNILALIPLSELQTGQRQIIEKFLSH